MGNRERERERHQFVVPPICGFTGSSPNQGSNPQPWPIEMML